MVDKALQREQTRERVKRYRALHSSVTQSVTSEANSVTSSVTSVTQKDVTPLVLTFQEAMVTRGIYPLTLAKHAGK